MIIPEWQDIFSHLNTLRAANGDYETPMAIYHYIHKHYTEEQIAELVRLYESENYRLNNNALVAAYYIVKDGQP